MSVRANSLQRVLLDGFLFASAMTVASAALTAFAQVTVPPVARVEGTATDGRVADDQSDSQLNTNENIPSGNPEESPRAKREAMVLGMKLYEVRTGNIRVDDVAATSPAWDAGIRRGDRLVSIDSVKPQSLAPWVDDIGRVLKDTPDGKSVSAHVERDGEVLALRIRVPVSKAAEVRDARQEEQAIANMAAGREQQTLGQQGGMMPAGGGDQTVVGGYPGGYGGTGGWGLGGFFDDETQSGSTSENRMANSAVAQLMSVNTLGSGAGNPNQPASEQLKSGGQASGSETSGGQVGIAGFQNNGQGVKAVVVVRGLPQGAYRVGIGQGDGLSGDVGNNAPGSGFANDGSHNGIRGRANGIANDVSNGVNNARGARAGNRGANNGAFDGGGFDGTGNPGEANRPNGQQPLGQPEGGARPGVQRPAGGSGQTPFFPNRPGPASNPVPADGTPGAGDGAAPSGASGAGGGAATGGANGGGGASLADPKGAAFLGQQLDAAGDMSQSTLNAPDPGAMPVDQSGNQENGQQSGNQANTRDSGLNPGEPPQMGNDFSSGDRNNINSGSPGGMSPFVSEIGILRVGPDGSGRVENQLEGMQVQNLAGMSVTVVSTMSQGGGGFSETTADNPRTVGAEQGAANQNGRFPQNNQSPQNNVAGMEAGQGGANSGSQGVVATGVIQLMDSGSSAPNMGEQRRGLSQGEERPVDRATEEQRNRSQISNPQQDFNPSQSQ